HRFLFRAYGAPPDLHSFPTRRSSDLPAGARLPGEGPKRPLPSRVDALSEVRELLVDGASHEASPLSRVRGRYEEHRSRGNQPDGDRKSTRLNSSHVAISYAVFCLKKK